MKYLLGILLFLSMTICNADIYQQFDQNDHVTYSDIPQGQNAQSVDLSQQNVTTSQTDSSSTAATKTPATAVESAPHTYNSFAIDSPKDQDTIQNLQTIPVAIKIDPDLQSGDKIQLFLDGKPNGDAAASTSLSLSQVERGSHQVYAELLDANNQVLKQSNTITIYVHLASALNH